MTNEISLTFLDMKRIVNLCEQRIVVVQHTARSNPTTGSSAIDNLQKQYFGNEKDVKMDGFEVSVTDKIIPEVEELKTLIEKFNPAISDIEKTAYSLTKKNID